MTEQLISYERTLSPMERVAASPVARIIADVLAYTRLADPDGSCDDAAHWSDPDVLSATSNLLARLETEGYAIVPSAQE